MPNIVYFPSRWGCFAYVMKNCDLLVSDPEFAIARIPRLLNCGTANGISEAQREHAVARGDLESGSDLVGEGLPPDALSTLARAGRVAGLDHEPLDVAVPDAAIVVAGRAEGEKVLGERR